METYSVVPRRHNSAREKVSMEDLVDRICGAEGMMKFVGKGFCLNFWSWSPIFSYLATYICECIGIFSTWGEFRNSGYFVKFGIERRRLGQFILEEIDKEDGIVFFFFDEIFILFLFGNLLRVILRVWMNFFLDRFWKNSFKTLISDEIYWRNKMIWFR